MEPQNLKTRPALNIIQLPYMLQARVKARGLTDGLGTLLYWDISTCSICQERIGYIFQAGMLEVEPRFDGGCECAHLGSRPATWAEAAQHLLQHGTAEDFKWWDIEQPGATPFADSLAQGAKILPMQQQPDFQIDRMMIDAVAGKETFVTVLYSGSYGEGVKQERFAEHLSSEQLQLRLMDVMQWPEASPAVQQWLMRQPLP